jgi:hypothetical protein
MVQGAMKSILEETPESFYKETLAVIETNARLAFERLKCIPGLKPVMPDVSCIFDLFLINICIYLYCSIGLSHIGQ